MTEDGRHGEVVIHAALVVAVLLAGCAGTTGQPTATPENSGVSFSTPSAPSETGYAFIGHPTDGWEYPIQVEFQRPEAGNWTEAYVFNVEYGETIEPPLTPGERYRVVVQDRNGHRRVVGALTYEPDDGHTVVRMR